MIVIVVALLALLCLGLLAGVFVTWRFLLPGLLLPRSEVKKAAAELVALHGAKTAAVVAQLEVQAWTTGDFRRYGKLRRISRYLAHVPAVTGDGKEQRTRDRAL